jgi:lysophospholipid acyltransferase
MPDARRLVRPLFMTPDGKTPLPSKKYYDIFTLFLTQSAFAFTVAPFILLGFRDTLLVWSRVYLYTLIGTAASFALFSKNLPVRSYLTKMQADRVSAFDEKGIEKVVTQELEKGRREQLLRRESVEHLGSAPTLGIAEDPEAEIDEIVAEVKKEIEERRRRGSLMQGFDVKRAVDEQLKKFKKG